MKKINHDSLMQRIMNMGKPGASFVATIPELELIDMTEVLTDVFMKQPVMLRCCAPLKILGDLHGQFNDLMRLFKVTGWPPLENYLFLGDYIDRGRWSIETITLLFCLKVKFPENFLLLRGNHETVIVNRIYGFYEDITRRYGTPRLFNAFQDAFNVMPLSAIVSDRILCMHGGLSPALQTAKSLDVLNEIHRPLSEPLNPSLPMDLLWADPDIKTTQFKISIRGVSRTFGPDVVTAVIDRFGLDIIVRAHQVVQDGYEFFHNRKLVTIFSAPFYCGQFDNAAAVMTVSKQLRCAFKILRPKFPNNVVKASMTNRDVTTYQKL